MYAQNEWITVDHFTIKVHQIKDEWVPDSDKIGEKGARSARMLVEYANHEKEAVDYSPYQWTLFNTDGFQYELASYNGFYGSDMRHRLRHGTLNVGQTVKGWIAFAPTKSAVLSYIRFTPSARGGKATADIGVIGGVPQKPKILEEMADRPLWRKLLDLAQNKSRELPPQEEVKRLVPGTIYQVLKPFEDFHGRMFVPADTLTFVQYQPPYHGLHILQFKEATIHLHADSNGDILGRLFDYLG